MSVVLLERTFAEIKNTSAIRRLSAISGHSSDKENPAHTGVIDERDDAQGLARRLPYIRLEVL